MEETKVELSEIPKSSKRRDASSIGKVSEKATGSNASNLKDKNDSVKAKKKFKYVPKVIFETKKVKKQIYANQRNKYKKKPQLEKDFNVMKKIDLEVSSILEQMVPRDFWDDFWRFSHCSESNSPPVWDRMPVVINTFQDSHEKSLQLVRLFDAFRPCDSMQKFHEHNSHNTEHTGTGFSTEQPSSKENVAVGDFGIIPIYPKRANINPSAV